MFKDLKQYQENKWPNYILLADIYTDMQVYEKMLRSHVDGKMQIQCRERQGTWVWLAYWFEERAAETQAGVRKESPDTVGRTKTSKGIVGNRAFSEQEGNKIKRSLIRRKLNGNEIAVLHFAFWDRLFHRTWKFLIS